MRAFSSLVFVFVLAGCTSASASATDGGGGPDGGGGQGVTTDAPLANSCETYAPPGSVCKGGGVCGIGYALSPIYVCAESAEVCCEPAVDAGVRMNDANGGSDAKSDAKAADAGHDATMTVHDAGHDSGVTEHVDSGHDTGTTEHVDSGHDAGHDAGMAVHPDSGGEHDGGSEDAGDAAHD